MKDELIPLIRNNIKEFSDNNYNHLFGNLYLAKTQAGLKNSMKHYHNKYYRDKYTFEQMLSNITNLKNEFILDSKKIKFPIIVEFVPMWFGIQEYTKFIIKEI